MLQDNRFRLSDRVLSLTSLTSLSLDEINVDAQRDTALLATLGRLNKLQALHITNCQLVDPQVSPQRGAYPA